MSNAELILTESTNEEEIFFIAIFFVISEHRTILTFALAIRAKILFQMPFI